MSESTHIDILLVEDNPEDLELALRALRFGLDFRWYYRGEGYRYRFTEHRHLNDLGEMRFGIRQLKGV